MSSYKWRQGLRLAKAIDANTGADELARINRQYGALTAVAVVDESRDEDAVLHLAFEWDDEKAGEWYRHDQARRLIRSLVVVNDDSEHREYVLVSNEKSTQYVSSELAVRSPDVFADALGRLESRMRDMQESIREFEQLAKRESPEPERLARIGMAVKALETASAAIAGLH